MLQKAPLIGSGSSTKNAIVSALSQNTNQTAQQLYRTVTKETNKPISYQALHKALKELEKETVIQRIQNKYSLHPLWLQSMEKWLQKAKNRETSQTNQDTRQPEVRIFHSVIEVGRWLIFEFFRYPNPEKQPSICLWKRMYSLIGLSKEEVEGVRETMGKEQYYILSESNTLIDHFLAEAFEKMGAHVKLGLPQPENFDTFAVGDYVAEVYFEAAHHNAWKALWENPKTMEEFDLEKTLQVMHTGYTTRIIIYHDPVRAHEIRKKALQNQIGLTAHSLYEVDRLLLDVMTKNHSISNEKQFLGIIWNHFWIPLFLDKKEYLQLKELGQGFEIFALSKGNTAIDRWCAQFWNTAGSYAKTGYKKTSKTDLLVCRNTVIQVHYPPTTLKKLDQFYQQTKNMKKLDIKHLFDNLFLKAENIPITISQNKTLAQETKKEILKEFNR